MAVLVIVLWLVSTLQHIIAVHVFITATPGFLENFIILCDYKIQFLQMYVYVVRMYVDNKIVHARKACGRKRMGQKYGVEIETMKYNVCIGL